MRPSRTFLILAAGCALGAAFPISSPAQTLELSFSEAQALLRERNETLRAAAEDVQRSLSEKAAARGLLMPKVDATARYTQLDGPIELGLGLDLGGIRDVILGLHPGVPPEAIPSFSKQVDYQVQDDTFWRASLNLTWPVYTGGRIAAARGAADVQVDLARQLRRRTEGDLTTGLVRAYFGARLAAEAVEVRRQVLAGLDRHLYEAGRLEQEGLIANVERLHAEVARAEATRELMKAQRDLEVAGAALSGLLSEDDSVSPSSPLFVQTAIAPVDSFRAAAQAANPELAALGAQRALAREACRAQRGTMLPEVALFGTKELATEDLTALDPRWAVGVAARLTLFDGFGNWHRTRAARATVRRVDNLESRARRDVGTLVAKRHADLLTSRDLYESLQSTLALAQENLRARTVSFQEGLSTSLEVVDARLTLAKVQLARLLAAHDFDVSLAELLEACGRSGQFDSLRNAADVNLQP